MSTDVPHTLYLKDKDKGRKPIVAYSETPYTQEEIDAMNREARRRNQEVMEELKREAEERKKKDQWEKVTIEEVMNEQKQ